MKHVLLIAALALFVGAGCVETTPSVVEETTPDKNVVMEDEVMEEATTDDAMEDGEAMEEKADGESMEDAEAADGSAEEAATETTTENTSEESTTAEESSAQSADGTYAIASGSSSYTVKKEFFEKPKEDISGTTPDVSGSIAVSNGAVTVDATIQNNFSSGSGHRDNHVKGLLKAPINIATSGASIENPAGLGAGQAIQQMVALDLTIAGVTKAVPFSVTVTPNGDALAVQGSASFNMEADFGIKPPSILNVYKVNPVLTVQFNVTANR